MNVSRCLGLSCLLLFPVAGRAATDAKSAALAGQVVKIFEGHCVDCHSQAKGRTEKNLDLTDLVAVGGTTRLVKSDTPVQSKLYRKIDEGAMPPDDNDPIKPPLNDQEKSVVLAWIAAGAPAPTGALDTTGRFIATKTTIKEIFQNLLEVDEEDRPFIRYLTLTVPYNAGDTDAKLEIYRRATSKLLNSLSRKPKIAHVTPAGTGGTLLRFDLRDIGWPAAKWDYLVARYPYAVEFAGADAAMLASAGGSPVVHLRADWFAFAATQPENYHFLLDLPATAQELEQSLGVNVADNIRGFQVTRGAIGPKRSGVSDHNRVVERHEIGNYLGAYWKSYDFASDIDRQNVIDRPLGPGQDAGEFQHNGGELIFNLPNGLQAYLLVNAAGERIDAGPIKIVNDKTALVGTEVINGLSCMKCHVNGMLPVADEVRLRLDQSPASYPADLHRAIGRLYPGTPKLAEWLAADAARFGRALAEAGAEQGATPEPVSDLVRRFLRPVTIKTAHAEVGLPSAEFQQRLAQSPALAGIRHDLEQTDVSRDNFIAKFQTIVTELRLGTPRAAQVATRSRPSETEGGSSASGAPVAERDFAFDLNTGVALNLTWIAPGSFQMGTAYRPGSDVVPPQGEVPVMRVNITKGFWLGDTEVTQAQWSAVMGENPSQFEGARLPVDSVTWDQAMEFCRKLTEREHAAGRLPPVLAYTLPTEAQWEYACRAGSTNDSGGPPNELDRYLGNGEKAPEPVGALRANAFGLHDMQSNVREWCLDWYGPYRGLKSDESVNDFTGPASGSLRVNRGGSWKDYIGIIRPSTRHRNPPGYKNADLGFRVALVQNP